jgi:hypothetical protein
MSLFSSKVENKFCLYLFFSVSNYLDSTLPFALDSNYPMTIDNPYLSHLNNSKKNSSSNYDFTSKEPLFGFLPRKVKATQVEKALVSETVFHFLSDLFRVIIEW